MNIMKMSIMALTLSLLIISCGKGEKKEQEFKIQSYERQESPSDDLADLKNADHNQAGEENNEVTEASEANATPKKNESTLTGADKDDVVELYLTGNDKMKYNKEKLEVKAGSTVKLVFEHVGEMSVQTMGHNFVLLEEGVDKIAFGQEAASYASDGYLPPKTDKVIAHTEMIGGGEKVTITFEAPSKGTYDYICSFPGHVALMNGKFTVI